MTGRRTARSPTPARRRRPIALTGTPGVGKSAVARWLARRWAVAEVADLAVRFGAARRRRGNVEVDLRRLRAALTADPARGGVDVLVGHLAHLLPVREAVVLRCEPRALLRRLGRSGRGTPAERRANFVSEALDLVLAEALAMGLPVYEVDTTARSARAVARLVDRRLRRPGPSRHGVVDWLAQPSVTEHLLDAVR